MYRSNWLLAGWVSLLGAGGCATDAGASNADAGANPNRTPPAMSGPSGQLQGQPVLTQEELDSRAQAAAGILARRLGVAEQELDVITAERVTWPNGAAGCPRPGMSYTQALVSGYRVVLGYKNREYHYHGRAGSDPFFCARPESSGSWIMDR